MNCQPLCVIGHSATTSSGTFDDLEALADIAQREGMWFHANCAFGAWVRLSNTHKNLVSGMDKADSLAVDLAPLIGGVLYALTISGFLGSNATVISAYRNGNTRGY